MTEEGDGAPQIQLETVPVLRPGGLSQGPLHNSSFPLRQGPRPSFDRLSLSWIVNLIDGCGTWLGPRAVVSNDDVEYGQELAHGRGQSDFLDLPCFAQPLVEDLDHRIVSTGYECSHVQGSTHRASATPHRRLPLNSPLSLLNGATPTSAAICFRFSCPSSGSSDMIVLDTTLPTPGTLLKRSSLILQISVSYEPVDLAVYVFTRLCWGEQDRMPEGLLGSSSYQFSQLFVVTVRQCSKNASTAASIASVFASLPVDRQSRAPVVG